MCDLESLVRERHLGRMLRSIPLLRGPLRSDFALQRFVGALSVVFARPGERLCREGEEADGFFFVREGRVRLTRGGERRRRFLLLASGVAPDGALFEAEEDEDEGGGGGAMGIPTVRDQRRMLRDAVHGNAPHDDDGAVELAVLGPDEYFGERSLVKAGEPCIMTATAAAAPELLLARGSAASASPYESSALEPSAMHIGAGGPPRGLGGCVALTMDRHTFQRLLFTDLAEAYASLPPADPFVFENNRRREEYARHCKIANAEMERSMLLAMSAKVREAPLPELGSAAAQELPLSSSLVAIDHRFRGSLKRIPDQGSGGDGRRVSDREAAAAASAAVEAAEEEDEAAAAVAQLQRQPGGGGFLAGCFGPAMSAYGDIIRGQLRLGHRPKPLVPWRRLRVLRGVTLPSLRAGFGGDEVFPAFDPREWNERRKLESSSSIYRGRFGLLRLIALLVGQLVS